MQTFRKPPSATKVHRVATELPQEPQPADSGNSELTLQTQFSQRITGGKNPSMIEKLSLYFNSPKYYEETKQNDKEKSGSEWTTTVTSMSKSNALVTRDINFITEINGIKN